jgi:hypothetical protein
MGDIEDLDSSVSVGSKSDIGIRVRLRKKQLKEDREETISSPIHDSDLPWKHTVYVKTWVCCLLNKFKSSRNSLFYTLSIDRI